METQFRLARFLFAGLLLGSATGRAAPSTDWSCLDTSQLSREATTFPQAVLLSAERHDAVSPALKDSQKLELLRAYVDRRTGNHILLFDIVLFSDSMIVYVVGRDGRIVDRFLT